MIYLAIPYTGQEELSYHVATHIAAELSRRGEVVFSPITHSHPFTRIVDLPGDWEFWGKIDREFIERADEMWIVMLDGWKESTGIKAEQLIAKGVGIPIHTLNVYHGASGSFIISRHEVWKPIIVPAMEVTA
jgi:hypothetical protein